MNRLTTGLRRLIVDESGAEVSELALVLALIVSGSLGAIALIGGQVQDLYNSFRDAFP